MAIEMEMKVGQLFLSISVKSRSFPHSEGSKSVITLKPGPTFPWGGRGRKILAPRAVDCWAPESR